MMIEHDDGGMARQAERVAGVVSAEASDAGIWLRYDTDMADPTQIRAGLISAGLPIAD